MRDSKMSREVEVYEYLKVEDGHDFIQVWLMLLYFHSQPSMKKEFHLTCKKTPKQNKKTPPLSTVLSIQK